VDRAISLVIFKLPQLHRSPVHGVELVVQRAKDTELTGFSFS
jgi:hypothetical protein